MSFVQTDKFFCKAWKMLRNPKMETSTSHMMWSSKEKQEDGSKETSRLSFIKQMELRSKLKLRKSSSSTQKQRSNATYLFNAKLEKPFTIKSVMTIYLWRK